MAEVGGVNNQSLYFAAAQQASIQTAKNEQTQKNQKSAAPKKSSFSNLLQQQIQEQNLLNEGLPVELAKMSEEEAVIYLKDAVDITGDRLKENQSYENVEAFRKSLSNFLKYVSRNNYEIVRKKRLRRDPFVTIQEIDHKLTELTNGILYQSKQSSIYSKSNLETLAAIDRLKGMVVDLIAM